MLNAVTPQEVHILDEKKVDRVISSINVTLLDVNSAFAALVSTSCSAEKPRTYRLPIREYLNKLETELLVKIYQDSGWETAISTGQSISCNEAYLLLTDSGQLRSKS